jgi:hypothetical protein
VLFRHYFFRDKYEKIVSVSLILAMVAGCATGSKDISATYASPLVYKDLNCEQLNGELTRVSSRSAELGGRLDQAASNDKAIMGVGLILFWPALFALGGTKQQEAEYARLKGEYEALNQSAMQKSCGIKTAAPAQAPAAPVAANTATTAAEAAPVVASEKK